MTEYGGRQVGRGDDNIENVGVNANEDVGLVYSVVLLMMIYMRCGGQ